MNPIDTTVFLWLNAGPAPSVALVAFATFMSQAMPGVAGAGLAATAVFGGAGLRRSVLRAVLAMSLSWLAVWAIRRGFPQPRPAALHLGWQWLQHSASSGFPSHHAAGAIACWQALASSPALRRRRRLVAVGLAIALTITWSRVYLGVHFPKDVLVGGALGWLAAEIVARLAARVGLMHRMHRMHRVRRLRRRRLAAAAAGA